MVQQGAEIQPPKITAHLLAEGKLSAPSSKELWAEPGSWVYGMRSHPWLIHSQLQVCSSPKWNSKPFHSRQVTSWWCCGWDTTGLAHSSSRNPGYTQVGALFEPQLARQSTQDFTYLVLSCSSVTHNQEARGRAQIIRVILQDIKLNKSSLAL